MAKSKRKRPKAGALSKAVLILKGKIAGTKSLRAYRSDGRPEPGVRDPL